MELAEAWWGVQCRAEIAGVEGVVDSFTSDLGIEVFYRIRAEETDERLALLPLCSRPTSPCIKDLVEANTVPAGATLIGTHNGRDHHATITDEGRIRVDGLGEFEAPSAAAAAVVERQSWNGWAWWRVKTPGGTTPLSRLRQDLIERRSASN